MKPAPFRYEAPRSVDEVVAILDSEGDDCRLLAGGQSLVPLMALRLARPSVVVDLNGVTDLDAVSVADGGLDIGAMFRQALVERSPVVGGAMPGLARATRLVGHPQLRARGTIGGSLAHADPAAEYPAIAVALVELIEDACGDGDGCR